MWLFHCTEFITALYTAITQAEQTQHTPPDKIQHPRWTRPRASFIRQALLDHRLARIAQLVEQGIENPCVAGSIPASGTTFVLSILKI